MASIWVISGSLERKKVKKVKWNEMKMRKNESRQQERGATSELWERRQSLLWYFNVSLEC